ncbi:MAG: protein kinase [Elusimicrobiota bacterium]|jgi:tetratricopeptide (TPR) repeat protein
MPLLSALLAAMLAWPALAEQPATPPSKEEVPKIVEQMIADYSGGNEKIVQQIREAIDGNDRVKDNPLNQIALMDLLNLAKTMPSATTEGEAKDRAKQLGEGLRAAMTKIPKDIGDYLGQAIKKIDPPATATGKTDPASPDIPVLPAEPKQDIPLTPSQNRWITYGTVLPNTPSIQEGQALGNLMRGDNRGAFQNFTRVINGGSATADNYYYRGFAAEKAGDHEQAHHDAGIALAISPRDARARALWRLTEGKASSIRLNPKAPLAALGPARSEDGAPDAPASPRSDTAKPERPLMDLRSVEAIIQEVKKQSVPEPEAASKKLAKEAELRLQFKDPDAALLLAEKAIEYNPKNAAAHNYRAQAYLLLENPRAAVADASAGLALAPGSIPLLHTRARAYAEAGDWRASMGDTLAILRQKPQDARALFGLARAQSGLGQRREMLESLRGAASADPRYQRAYETALQLPEASDTDVLFSDMEGALSAPPPKAPGRRPPWLILFSVFIGGALIVFGLFHPGSGDMREAVRASVLRWLSRSPVASSGEAGFADASGSPLGSAFWSRYECKREVAVGGMGIVYEAVDRGLGRRVAVKKMRDEIRADPRERALFIAEAKTVGSLRHPNVVEIHDIVEDGPDLYLVFEYAEGKTLHELVAERGPLPFDEALKIFRGVCTALEFAHQHGVVHRDLKPANIMVAPDGAAKVMDFGVARQAKDALTKLSQTTTIAGTPPYMSPEQEQGMVGRETDIYALGVSLYQALTATLPFEGTPAAMLLAKMAGKYDRPSVRVSGHPAGLDAFIEKTLAPDPKARWKTPAEFFAALSDLRHP